MISSGICRGCGNRMTVWFILFRSQPIWLCRDCRRNPNKVPDPSSGGQDAR